MRALEVSEAVDSRAKFGRGRGRPETWVLTRSGRSVAMIVPIDDDDYFRMRLANHPSFIRIIERSRARYAATGGRSLAEMRRDYVAPAHPTRRSSSGRHETEVQPPLRDRLQLGQRRSPGREPGGGHGGLRARVRELQRNGEIMEVVGGAGRDDRP
jgi:hypothetical protein